MLLSQKIEKKATYEDATQTSKCGVEQLIENFGPSKWCKKYSGQNATSVTESLS